MNKSDETKHLLLSILFSVVLIVFVSAFIFTLYWMLGNFILQALNIIFNHK